LAPLIIKTTVNSSITRAAERCVFHIKVFSTGKPQKTVSNEVTQTCNKLRKTFDTLAPQNNDRFAADDAAVTQFTMGPFQTTSYVPRDDDGRGFDREYTASAKFTAIFRDFQKLGETTSLSFRMPHIQLERTEWRLTESTLWESGI